MITYDMIIEAQNYLVENWGENGKEVIANAFTVNPFRGTMTDFLGHCTACGGNWGVMFLTGIEELYPNVYDVIPTKMGPFAFTCICYVLLLCGVDTTK